MTHTICRMHNYVLNNYAFYYIQPHKFFGSEMWLSIRSPTWIYRKTLLDDCTASNGIMLATWWSKAFGKHMFSDVSNKLVYSKTLPVQQRLFKSLRTEGIANSFLYRWNFIPPYLQRSKAPLRLQKALLFASSKTRNTSCLFSGFAITCGTTDRYTQYYKVYNSTYLLVNNSIIIYSYQI